EVGEGGVEEVFGDDPVGPLGGVHGVPEHVPVRVPARPRVPRAARVPHLVRPRPAASHLRLHETCSTPPPVSCRVVSRRRRRSGAARRAGRRRARRSCRGARR
ncbi:Os02g0458950, partial [Oryza sativa Japonica Group]